MPKKKDTSYQRGFIDPLSLFAVIFLVATIAVGTAVTNNRNITLSPEKEASSCECVYGRLTGSGCPSQALGQACSVVATPTPTPRTTPTPTCNCVNGTLTGSACGASAGKACALSTATPNTNSSNNTTQTVNTTPTPSQTPVPTCDCVYGKLTGNGCGASLGMACSVYSTPTPTPTTTPTQTTTGTTNIATPTPAQTPTPTCDCVYGKLTGGACGASTGMACSVYSTPTPTPVKPVATTLTCDGKPIGTRVCNNAGGFNFCDTNGKWYSSKCPANTSCINGQCLAPTGCSCVDGKYVGSGCGHSTGYSCSTTTNVCEVNTCSAKCASQVAGNIGTCVSGGCVCGVPKLKDNGLACNVGSECSSGNCYAGSQTLGGSPFDTTKTCHALSITGMDTTVRDINTTAGAVMTAELAGLVAAPVIADIAGLAAANGGLSALPSALYSYGTASLATLPSSVQTAIAVGGTVAGYAGATAGTVACIQNPYSDACTSYVGVLQGDPMAMIQLAQSADSLVNTAIRSTLNKTFQSVWGNKISNVTPVTEYENLPIERYLELKNQGQLPDSWSVVSQTDDSIRISITENYDPYQNLLDQAKAAVDNGKSPTQAVADLMQNKIARGTESTLSNSLNVTPENNLSAKVWCGDANCVQQSLVAKQLLNDLGVSETQTLYGLGGTAPFIHSATLTPDGVILFGDSRILSPDKFIKYTNYIKVFGTYQLPK